ncbi:MAG: hypothetical protein MUP14_03415 [Dehalococcoidia bacterium]|nr:hypothetical protein [Dehalococcoidia bacterium]
MNTIRVAGLTAAASAVVFLLCTLPASAHPLAGFRYAGDITGCAVPPCGTVDFKVSGDGLQVQEFKAHNVPGDTCTFAGEWPYPPPPFPPLAIVGDSFGPGPLDWYQVSGSFFRGGIAAGTIRLKLPSEDPPCDTGLLGWSQPVGGIAELPDVSGSSAANYIPLAGVAAAALVALTAGGWHARRRPLR